MHQPTPSQPGQVIDIDALKQMLGRHRSSVLSYLLKLNKCIDANHQDLVQALCQRFCEVLVDYISVSQFRLCDEFELDSHHLMALQNSAAHAVAFNDGYGNLTDVPVRSLKRSLEHLALVLEARFEVEDEIYHGACAPHALA